MILYGIALVYQPHPAGTSPASKPFTSAPHPSKPNKAQCAAPGGPNPVAPNGVAGAGAFFLLDREAVSIAGAVGGGDSGRVSGPSRGSPQLRRPLGEPSGWRLAAD
ncbi:unnamed protein product [Pleuronectes platessa]|uniref:Uncharacterized protein n=1 Tax=Pleuronectes platessa TaxID=8262 RepID=A0A9N7VKX9_PLEPL|nr:unnamed protein product [Pleuronectes platessa]